MNGRLQSRLSALEKLVPKKIDMDEDYPSYSEIVDAYTYSLFKNDPILAPIAAAFRTKMMESTLPLPEKSDTVNRYMDNVLFSRHQDIEILMDILLKSFSCFEPSRIKSQEQAAQAMERIMEACMQYPDEVIWYAWYSECLNCGINLPTRRKENPLIFIDIFDSCPVCGGELGHNSAKKDYHGLGPWWIWKIE
jgi:hypothetical protein